MSRGVSGRGARHTRSVTVIVVSLALKAHLAAVGAITLQFTATSATGPAPISLASGDFNGDGRADLATVDRGSSAVSVLLLGANGSGIATSIPIHYSLWSGAVPASLSTGQATCSAAPDRPDLAVAMNGGPVALLYNNGAGGFALEPKTEDPQWNYAWGSNSAVVAMFSASGSAPAVVGVNSNSPTGQMRSRVSGTGGGDGCGGYQGSDSIQSLPSGPVAIAIASVDSLIDADRDLLVVNSTANSVSVLLFAGNSAPAGAGQTTAGIVLKNNLPPPVPVGPNPVAIVAADFNNDQKVDFAVLCNGDDTLRIYTGNGLGGFVAGAVISVPPGATAIASGDLDGDGRADLAITCARPAGFQGLGFLAGGNQSEAYAVSGDGRVVVGRSLFDDGVHNGWQAFERRLQISEPLQGLGDLLGGGFHSEAYGVSQDGSIIVGFSDSGHEGFEAFRWTAPTATQSAASMQPLGDLPGGAFTSLGFGISSDGSVVTGWSKSNAGISNRTEAFRWTQAGGMVGLADLGGPNRVSMGYACSADGSVLVGEAGSAQGEQAYRWASPGPMQGIGFLPGGSLSQAFAVSANGAVVVGGADSSQGYQSFRWVSPGPAPLGLGFLGADTNSVALDCNADGSVVVGKSQGAGATRAFYWSAATGTMQDLRTLLIQEGAAGLEQWTLLEATGVSDDARTIVGFGINPNGQTEAWAATMPATATLTPVGDLPGGDNYSVSGGVSRDGSVAVGSSASAIGANSAFRWTSAGISFVGILPGGNSSNAAGTSRDGSVVVGFSASTQGVQAFRWSQAGGLVGLGDLPGGSFASGAYAVSALGTIAVGFGATSVGAQPCFWNGVAAPTALPLIAPDIGGEAWDVSADGGVIVGRANLPGGQRAYRWIANAPQLLGSLAAGEQSAAFAVSDDGQVIVGDSYSATGSRPFKWTIEHSIEPLISAPFFGESYDTNADGSVVLGMQNLLPSTISTPFVWTSARGPQSVVGLLGLTGSSFSGWSNVSVQALSADARTIIGNAVIAPGVSQAFVAHFSQMPLPNGVLRIYRNVGGAAFSLAQTLAVGCAPSGVAIGQFSGDARLDVAVSNAADSNVMVFENTSPASCPADINGDGVVNSSDLGLLLGAWGLFMGPQDINGDATVNSTDLSLLLGGWGPCP